MRPPTTETHGLSRTATYKTWKDMIYRCTRERHANWPQYGGRGITVCARWMSFENFVADMGRQPRGLTLERINNDGGYNPDNCKWATRREQQQNTRRSRTKKVS